MKRALSTLLSAALIPAFAVATPLPDHPVDYATQVGESMEGQQVVVFQVRNVARTKAIVLLRNHRHFLVQQIQDLQAPLSQHLVIGSENLLRGAYHRRVFEALSKQEKLDQMELARVEGLLNELRSKPATAELTAAEKIAVEQTNLVDIRMIAFTKNPSVEAVARVSKEFGDRGIQIEVIQAETARRVPHSRLMKAGAAGAAAILFAGSLFLIDRAIQKTENRLKQEPSK